jgi:hypothetical protein
MLREQFIVYGIEWLAGGIDREGQRHRERLPEDGLRDNTGIALEQRAFCAVYRDRAGGLKQVTALRAVVGGNGFWCHGLRVYTHLKTPRKTAPKNLFILLMDTKRTIGIMRA